VHRGYVKLWRKSLDSSFLQNASLVQFWVWCLLKATHKPVNVMVGFQEITLEPGQFIFGRKAAAKDLKSTERSIRTCVEYLSKSEKATIKTTNKFSIISLTNWTIYQTQEKSNDQQNDQQATNKRPASDHKQEVKEHKEKKLQVRKAAAYSQEYEELWKVHKYGVKSKGWEEYQMMDTPPPHDEMVAILRSQVAAEIASRKNGHKLASLPHMERWIKNRMWENGIVKINEHAGEWNAPRN